MILNKLTITGFGKLSNNEIPFREGLNIVYGTNESGKSTMQAFINAMLYGQSRARSSGMTEKERYRPWNGSAYAGSMEYTLKDGSRFRVWRDFGTGQVKVFDSNLSDITDEFSQSRSSGVLFAEKHLGVDRELFTRTSFVPQLGVRLNEEGQALLSDRIASMVQDGSDRSSYLDARRILEKTLLEKVGTDRTSGKPLDKTKDDIHKLEDEKKHLEGIQEKVLELEQTLNMLRSSEREAGALVEYARLLKDTKKTKENYHRVDKDSGNIESLRIQLKQMNKELEELNLQIPQGISIFDQEVAGRLTDMQKIIESKKRISLTTLWMALVILAGSLTVLFPKLWFIGFSIFVMAIICWWITYTLGTRTTDTHKLSFSNRDKGEVLEETEDILTAAGVDSISGYFDKKRDISLLMEKKRIIKNSIEFLNEQLSVIKPEGNDPAAIEKEYDEKNSRLKDFFTMLEIRHAVEPPEVLLKKNLEELEDFYDTSLNNLKNIQIQITETETQIKVLAKDMERLPLVEEELLMMRVRKEELEDFGHCIRTAMEYLSACSKSIKEEITPLLMQRISEYTKGITGVYNEVGTSDDGSGLRVSINSGNVIPVWLLSGGTIDQVYLAVRLAMSEVLSENGEPLPLTFDEVFSQYDENRLGLAAHLLKNLGSHRQVILFTCRKTEAEQIADIVGNVNLICLGRDGLYC